MITAQPTNDIADRLALLDRLVELGSDRLPDSSTQQCVDVLERSRARLRHGTAHTVVAIAGSTGAGKSSLLNAIVGQDIATVGVRRPTTSQTQAVVWGGGANALLDWLEIGKRHHVDGGETDGLILLDLPDHDSIEAGNRAEVDRLVGLVDLFVWVADPQKYADDSLHNGYLKRLAGHGDVMVFALSKIDTVTEEQAAHCLTDFARLIAADGIDDPTVLAVSSQNGTGIGDLQTALADVIAQKAAVVGRIEADLQTLASELAVEQGPAGRPSNKAKSDLVHSLTSAADADAAAGAIGAHHRHVGQITLGWPPTRWLRRFRKSPILELPTRSNSPTMTPQVHSALRDYGEAQSADLAGPWRTAVRDASTGQADAVIDQLDRAGASALRASGPHPRWWSAGAAVQWFFAGAAALGLVWLIALLLVDGFLRIDIAEVTPDYRGTPVPTWLFLGGLVGGFLLTWLLRAPLAVGAERRSRRARSEVAERVDDVVTETVIPAVEAQRTSATEYVELVGQLTDSGS